MTQDFYERLGVERQASTAEIRVAYSGVVAKLGKRRKALAEHGGDTIALDLVWQGTEEAWGVLSDAVRRRKYDAMLKVAQEGRPDNHEALWAQVNESLTAPGALTAAELVDAVTDLGLGTEHRSRRHDPIAVEEVASPELPATDPLGGRIENPSEAALVDLEALADGPGTEDDTDNSGVLVPLPGASPLRINTPLRIVDGKDATSQVLVMPEKEINKPVVSTEEVARMVDELGATGELLRSVREVRGLSLQDVANTTRIAARFLEAIEQEELDDLPSLTFVRGYVREMARVLLLDEEHVVRGYMEHVSGKAK
jgi:hypothetical protein